MVSARTGWGIPELAAIERDLPRLQVEIDALVPYALGGLVSRVHEHGEVLAEEHTEVGTRLRARVDPALAAELDRYTKRTGSADGRIGVGCSATPKSGQAAAISELRLQGLRGAGWLSCGDGQRAGASACRHRAAGARGRRQAALRTGPAFEPAELARRVRAALAGPAGVLPVTGVGDAAALAALTEVLGAGAVDPAHPLAAAHLHCPPLPVAVAADLVAGLLSQSVDSWDQGPAAIKFEREVVSALAELAGLSPARASGAITTGGSESNLMGLLLARDAGHRTVICSSTRISRYSEPRPRSVWAAAR